MGRKKRLNSHMRAWLLPLAAVLWNQAVYYSGSLIARDFQHHNWTTALDRATPFLPWTVSVYFFCYLFWAIAYILYARQEKREAYRFFFADFLAKAVCLVCFILLPTTNIRPSVTGEGLWNVAMRFLYRIDAPVNLFPSIHCLVSWLCWAGVRNQRNLPRWYRWFSFGLAAAVCVSTLTTKQHVIWDVAGGVTIQSTQGVRKSGCIFQPKVVSFKQW